MRKATANKLYEALVTYDDIVPEDSLEEITTTLSEFTWWETKPSQGVMIPHPAGY